MDLKEDNLVRRISRKGLIRFSRESHGTMDREMVTAEVMDDTIKKFNIARAPFRGLFYVVAFSSPTIDRRKPDTPFKPRSLFYIFSKKLKSPLPGKLCCSLIVTCGSSIIVKCMIYAIIHV